MLLFASIFYLFASWVYLETKMTDTGQSKGSEPGFCRQVRHKPLARKIVQTLPTSSSKPSYPWLTD